ncbi:hypothetical protein KI387_007298, partial [Taxus chinensis]
YMYPQILVVQRCCHLALLWLRLTYIPRRLWGKPSEDLPLKQKYLAVFTVGLAQKDNVNNEISK